MDLANEGRVDVPGGSIWFGQYGEGGGVPLLCLHGGPGFAHGYLRSLADLCDERPVIFYDQLGCGSSDRPDDPALWTVERSIEELQAVRDTLGLEETHIFGNSWGGMLALAYALRRGQDGIRSLIISSSPATVSCWMEYSYELRAQLPDRDRETIATHWDRGYFSCPEFTAAAFTYYRRHLCRIDPWPEELERSFAGIGTQVYETMWGPSEFGPCTGVLNTFDIMPELHQVTVPTLMTIGRHDECPLDHFIEMQRAIAGARLEVFEDSSHTQFLEERESYMRTVRQFLQDVGTSSL